MANGNRQFFRELECGFFSCKNFEHQEKIHQEKTFVELFKNASRL